MAVGDALMTGWNPGRGVVSFEGKGNWTCAERRPVFVVEQCLLEDKSEQKVRRQERQERKNTEIRGKVKVCGILLHIGGYICNLSRAMSRFLLGIILMIVVTILLCSQTNLYTNRNVIVKRMYRCTRLREVMFVLGCLNDVIQNDIFVSAQQTSKMSRKEQKQSTKPRPLVLNVRWFAPFLSGGGYSSEALSYVVELEKHINVAVVQHGVREDFPFPPPHVADRRLRQCSIC
eukprot:756461-Hanusia_phi.AAC.1